MVKTKALDPEGGGQPVILRTSRKNVLPGQRLDGLLLDDFAFHVFENK
jgi:hypothetical protein